MNNLPRRIRSYQQHSLEAPSFEVHLETEFRFYMYRVHKERDSAAAVWNFPIFVWSGSRTGMGRGLVTEAQLTYRMESRLLGARHPHRHLQG